VQGDRMLGHWGTPSSGKTVRSTGRLVNERRSLCYLKRLRPAGSPA
jgi:hypothetical protein